MKRMSMERLTIAVGALMIALNGVTVALAQDGGTSASPAGLSMLVLFMGVAAIFGVFVIRWSQSASDDDE